MQRKNPGSAFRVCYCGEVQVMLLEQVVVWGGVVQQSVCIMTFMFLVCVFFLL